ncbi:hypothetical protein MMC28_001798 [Mycoblastus sanguinarius]|nr:hypothetical protein [Mycoblastus sanguinarius]
MSTQDGSGIRFDICNEQQNFRLLELPPSLLELINANQPPNLFLKSSAPIVANGPAQASSNAVLCTDDRTYQVRQVHSSNSVFILQPSEASRLAEDDSIPSSSLLAIAQCTATLELIPTSPSGIAFLRQALPLYKGPQTNAMKMSKSVMVSTSMEKMEKMGKQAMLENAPLPSNEFDKAWKEMCAFEFEGQAWLPTALELISVWESILSAATVRSVDLGENFVIATLRRVVEEDGHEGVLFDTVINRLRSDDEDLMDGCALFSRFQSVPWVGIVLLESLRSSTDEIFSTDFLHNWQNQLPENWRKHATIDMLRSKCTRSSSGKLVFSDGPGENAEISSSTPANTSGNASRKWHEKFRNARR